MRWNKLGREDEADGEAEKEGERKSHVIVVTDACLPLIGSESPVSARILINYELPTKKVLIFYVFFRSVFSVSFMCCILEWSALCFIRILFLEFYMSLMF